MNAHSWRAIDPFGKISAKDLQLINRTFGVPSSQTHKRNNYYLSWGRMGFYNGSAVEVDDVRTEPKAPDNDLKVRRGQRTTRYFVKNDKKRQQQIYECVRNFLQQKHRNTLEFDEL
ncbi:unnamed protein product [Didymodactylos carnosus]|uniref:Uncharacterized protein n=1 Tax=Didymodactylos carnosus TaxID=1234261 RepID=A0A815HGZ7_9BILA|nr:unnamed protein product [Didymodactylos carnosus]CAF4222926.1 unnamed protein product [Didymodactylos carnosus]